MKPDEDWICAHDISGEWKNYYLSDYNNSRLELKKSAFVDSKMNINNILGTIKIHNCKDLILNFLVENVEVVKNLTNESYCKLLEDFALSVKVPYILLDHLLIYIHLFKKNDELQFLQFLKSE